MARASAVLQDTPRLGTNEATLQQSTTTVKKDGPDTPCTHPLVAIRVHDAHAEMLARKAFILYLHEQIRIAAGMGTTQDPNAKAASSIFAINSSSCDATAEKRRKGSEGSELRPDTVPSSIYEKFPFKPPARGKRKMTLFLSSPHGQSKF